MQHATLDKVEAVAAVPARHSTAPAGSTRGRRRRVGLVTFGVTDGSRLGGAKRLDLLVGVASVELGVGGDGQAAGTSRPPLPFLPVGHGLGEGLFLLPVVVAHGAVAGGQVLMAGGAVVIASLSGGIGFSIGTDSAQGGVEGAEPGEPQLFSDVAGCQGGLGGVGVAEQPQPAVGQGRSGRRDGGSRTSRGTPRWSRPCVPSQM